MIKTSQQIAKIEESFNRVFKIPDFDNPKKRIEFMGEIPDQDTYRRRKERTLAALTRDTHEGLAACYVEPLLTKEQEQHLFRKYNLIKYMAQAKFMVRRYADCSRILRASHEVRNQITLSNLRLAVYVAKRYSMTPHWDDYIGEAYAIILRTVDYFDFRRGLKFSTYATWALQQNLGRMAQQISRHDTKFEYIGDRDTVDTSRPETEFDLGLIRFEEMVSDIQGRTPESTKRLQQIIRGRFLHGQTLKEVADSLSESVTRERIRQLETRSIDQLRERVKARL